MKVYSTFFRIFKRHAVGTIMYLILVTVLACTNMISTKNGSGKELIKSRYSICVVNEDDSEISERLYEYIEKNHDIKKGDYTEEQMKDLLHYQGIYDYIIIPKGFGEAFENMEKGEQVSKLLVSVYDEALPAGVFINMQINQFLDGVKNYCELGMSLDEACDRSEKSLDIKGYVSINESEESENYVPYIGFVELPFGLLAAIFTGVIPVILCFEKQECKNRMEVSFTSSVSANLSILGGCITIAACVMGVLILAVSLYTDKSQLFTQMWWLSVLNVVVYTISVTMMLAMVRGLPLKVGERSSSSVSMMITTLIGLAFAFIGGTFVDLSILGDGVKKVGRFIPNYWYSVATKRIWYENAGFSEVAECFGFQLLFGVMFLAVGLAFAGYFRDNKIKWVK